MAWLRPTRTGSGMITSSPIFDAALVDDGLERADQVLVGAHASGDAVHDNTDFMCGHLNNG